MMLKWLVSRWHILYFDLKQKGQLTIQLPFLFFYKNINMVLKSGLN